MSQIRTSCKASVWIAMALGIIAWQAPLAGAQCYLGQLPDPYEAASPREYGPHTVVFNGDFLYEGAYWVDAPLGGGGMVRVYQRIGDIWETAWEIQPPDPDRAGEFGWAIAPIGPEPHILVGDPDESIVWELRLEAGAWQVVREIHAPDEDINGFGNAIVYKDGRLAIGASRSEVVYLYRHEDDAWVFERRAKPFAGNDYSQYGHSLALDGSQLLIGSFWGDAAEVWTRKNSGWVRSGFLHDPDPTNESGFNFGWAVAIRGDVAVATEPMGERGVAYLYRFVGGGQGWQLEQTLHPWGDDGSETEGFGWCSVFAEDRLFLLDQHGRYGGTTFVFHETDTMGWLPAFSLEAQLPRGHLHATGLAVQNDTVAVGTLAAARNIAPVELHSIRPRCLCIADFNEDGRINPADVSAFLNAWNVRDPAADANADGLIDTRDVSWFLHEWNTRKHCI